MLVILPMVEFLAFARKPRDCHAEARRRGEKQMHELDEITGAIVDSAIQFHRSLGPGLLESVYEVVLARVLSRSGFKVETQKILSFRIRRHRLSKRVSHGPPRR
jgi:hypothetical protein